jgi:uncharacterized protein (TIGR02996 family)
MAKPAPLLLAVAQHPDDDAPRLAYADRVGGDEAEFIRVQVERARLPPGDPRDGALARREQEVWNARARVWSAQLQKRGLNAWTYERGFIVAAGALGYAFQPKVFQQLPTLRRFGLNVSRGQDARAAAQTEALLTLDEVTLWSFQNAACWKVWLGSPVFARLASLAVQVAPPPEVAPALAKGALPGLRNLSRLSWPAKVLAATLPAMAGLRELSTDHTPMTAAQAKALVDSGALARLVDLQLYEAGLTDAALAPLWTAPAGLRTLSLLSNPLTTRSVQALADSGVGQSIETLNLGFCPVGAGLAALGRLPRLKHLKLRRVGLDGAALDRLLAALGPRLETLELGQEPLVAAALQALAGASLPRLTRLDLPLMALDAAALATLARAPGLRSVLDLNLSSNPVGDAGVRALADAGWERLRTLDLDGCGLVDGGGLAAWPLTSGLSGLSLNGNHIEDQAQYGAIQARFGPQAYDGPGLALGYQHPVPATAQVPEAERAEAPEAEPEQRRKPAAPPKRRDRKRGLTELLTRPHFATWDGYVDAKAVARAEQALHDAAAALLALGEQATAAAQKAALKRCVVRLNKLEDHIHTIEAEDIDEELSLLVRYTPWAAWEEEEGEALIDQWRDF